MGHGPLAEVTPEGQLLAFVALCPLIGDHHNDVRIILRIADISISNR